MQPTIVSTPFFLRPIWVLFRKQTNVGAPRELNYGAMVYSLIARVVERIPSIKDFVQRLKNDPYFRFDCGFLHSDNFPSEASYSRMIKLISESDGMTRIHDDLILLATQEENIAIDATHFEARDRATGSKNKEKPAPKKRGRKPKAEREQWLKEKEAAEAALPIYEKED